MYSLVVNVGRFTNKWDFWVYPYEIKEPLVKDDIRIVRKLDEEHINFLNNGGMVLLTPVKGSIKPEKGGNIAVGFSSIFWNTAWTLKQAPHTLGILCNPDHPMLKDFPTEYHSAYQWRDAMMHSNAILLNELGKNFQPVVRIIDDWFTNRPLGLITEANVGKGKIVFTGIDLLTDAEKRPEARQLTYSILKYMRSGAFNPSQEAKAENIKKFFRE
ncbi:MAG TPA: beta-glucuronidase, partial [Ignavibacteriales bacterium]|nr:beta-glucuronidase [Ignavibacteriales bacterium]